MMKPFIEKADFSDLEEILDLQYHACQSEADLFGSRDIRINDELVFVYLEKC